MANNFHQKLIERLKEDRSLWDEEDELITAAIYRRARRLDHNLIRLLLSDDEIKAEFLYRMRLNIEFKYLRERGESNTLKREKASPIPFTAN